MYKVEVIKESSSYSMEYKKDVIESFSSDDKKEANKKKKEFIKKYDMKFVWIAYINRDWLEIYTNY